MTASAGMAGERVNESPSVEMRCMSNYQRIGKSSQVPVVSSSTLFALANTQVIHRVQVYSSCPLRSPCLAKQLAARRRLGMEAEGEEKRDGQAHSHDHLEGV